MKRLLPLLLLCSFELSAQVNTEEVVRRVADHVIQTTSFTFKNNKTGEQFESTKGKDTSVNVNAESKFNKWQYVNGVLTVGMLRLSDVLKDNKYADYSRKNFDFIFSNLDYFKRQFDAGVQRVEYRPVFRIGSLDDCGSMSAGLLDVYAFDKRKEYLDYLTRVGDYIINTQVKFPDGTLARNGPRKMTLWADDLYMSVPYLARMGKLTGDNKYFDFAIKQVESFNRYLYHDASGLYYHCYYNDENMNGVARWGRCNGWVALAQVELLNNLPANHPKRADLIKLLLRQIVGFSRYQDTSGMWHQVLDRSESYAESSVTAMYVYTVAKAVNEGWINKRFISIAQNGWDALAKKITADGQIPDICIGTSIEEDIRYYFNRPAALNDTHGLGAFLMAGAEMIRAKEKLGTTSLVLPEPYATPANRKSSKVIGWPEGKTPVAPAGFTVTKYAGGLNSPRWIYVTPNGDVLVSESRTNRKTTPNDIIIFRDTDKDGKPDIQQVFMSNLNQPLGMLVLNDWLYVGNTDGVYRYPYKAGQLSVTDKGEKILDLPAGGYNNHWTRNLLVNADGSKIYVTVGFGSNVAEHGMENEIRRACILEINPDGSGERIFAEGIRNPVGLAWQPGTKTMWTAVNERDNLGDDLVPDYLTSVKDGGFYGWPYAYFGQHEDPRLKGQRPDLVAKTLVPDVPLGAHTASLGLVFYTKKTFPSKYYNGAFVGQHGSWNRSVFSGYRVVFIPFNNGKPGIPEDFLTGFIADESRNEVYGRPVGVTVLEDGSMLVADDEGKVIWRVSRK